MSRIAPLLCIPVLVGLWSCSGGGSSGGSASPAPVAVAQIVFDTAAGSAARVTARLDGVAFERADGSMAGRLMDSPAAVLLADPDGEFCSVSVANLPTDIYTAVHLVFAPGSVRAHHADGHESQLRLAASNLRVAFEVPTQFPTRERDIVRIGNRGDAFDGTGGSSATPIDPGFDGGPSSGVPVRYARLEVLSIDAQSRRITAELSTSGHPTVAAEFADGAILIHDDVQLAVDDFLAALQIGSIVQIVDGELVTDAANQRKLTVFVAVDLGIEDPHGNGRKSEVHGCISAIDAASEHLTLGLYRVDKGVENLPDPLPGTLDVDAGSARIKWVPRHGRHPGHLPFSALTVGMSVEVEWLGPAGNGVVPAMKVDIREASSAPLRSFAGDVSAIDGTSNQLTLGLDSPIEVGGTSYTSADVRLTNDTIVLGGSPPSAGDPLTARFHVGDAVFALARWDPGDVFVADYLRLVETSH